MQRVGPVLVPGFGLSDELVVMRRDGHYNFKQLSMTIDILIS